MLRSIGVDRAWTTRAVALRKKDHPAFIINKEIHGSIVSFSVNKRQSASVKFFRFDFASLLFKVRRFYHFYIFQKNKTCIVVFFGTGIYEIV
jgi:hypothetical protein